jgi:hypothetical protein
MRAAQPENPVALVLDVHAPHHGDTSCYAFGSAEEDDRVIFQAQARWSRLLAAADESQVGYGTDLRARSSPPRSARDYLRRTFQTPVLTLEVSYHLSQRGVYLTSRDYLEFGRAAARATVGFLGETE